MSGYKAVHVADVDAGMNLPRGYAVVSPLTDEGLTFDVTPVLCSGSGDEVAERIFKAKCTGGSTELIGRRGLLVADDQGTYKFFPVTERDLVSMGTRELAENYIGSC